MQEKVKKQALCAICIFIVFMMSYIIYVANTGGSKTYHNNGAVLVEESSKKFSGTRNETVTETIKYASTTVNDPNLEEGTVVVRTSGVNGKKTITYSVTYEEDKEVSRKKISEEITQQPVNEVKAVGTKHVYTGYCRVEGTYRRRYASCVGDYSPQAKKNAENKAYECNASSRAVQGCYSTYR